MRNLVAARWIGVAGVVVVLSGCTGGSAGPDLATGGEPPAVSGEPTLSVSASTDPVGGGPVLTVGALPFGDPADAALPAPRRQALQQVLVETVRDSTRVPGVTAAVLSPAGAWTGRRRSGRCRHTAGPRGDDRHRLGHQDVHRRRGAAAGRSAPDRLGRAGLDLPGSSAVGPRTHGAATALAHQRHPRLRHRRPVRRPRRRPGPLLDGRAGPEIRHRPAESARAAGDVLQQQQLPAARAADREGDRPELPGRGAPRPAARSGRPDRRAGRGDADRRRWPRRT